MVKKQKERQYNSAREQRELSHLRTGRSTTATGRVNNALPFSHCALSLVPFETPVCIRLPSLNLDGSKSEGDQQQYGIIVENSAILPFLMKHKKDPITGRPMTSRDLITLHMDKDEEEDQRGLDGGSWQCPVMAKAFNDRTKVVAIMQPNQKEAYVYSYNAYQELNVKAKNFTDLTTGEPFQKPRDVIILYDPDNEAFLRRRAINTFHHIVQGGGRPTVGESHPSSNVRHSMTASRIMEQLEKKRQKEEASNDAGKKRSLSSLLTSYNSDDDSDGGSEAEDDDLKDLVIYASDVVKGGVQYSTGKSSISFTSTFVDQRGDKNRGTDERRATREEILQSQFRLMKFDPKFKGRKGYIKIETNLGDLVLELHCDIAPRTCTNFLTLCEEGKYDGSKFHRLIPSFCIQGGKPAQEDEVEKSIWGGSFADEFDDRLKHEGTGILSMANAGKNTNKRQFFITFKSCPHLDRKHSVFGKVIKGVDDVLLQKMQKVPTNKKDRPKQDIVIISTQVLENPAAEARRLERERFVRLNQERNQGKGKAGAKKISSSDARQASPTVQKVNPIGKYLNLKNDKSSASGNVAPAASATEEKDPIGAEEVVVSRFIPPPKKTKFGDFSGW